MTNAISPGTRIMQAEATYVRMVLKLGICSVTKLRRLFVTLECVEIRIYAHTIEAKLVLSLSTCCPSYSQQQETAKGGQATQ